MEEPTLEQKVRDFKVELLISQNDFLRKKLMEAYDIIDKMNKENLFTNKIYKRAVCLINLINIVINVYAGSFASVGVA